MSWEADPQQSDPDAIETREWMESFDSVLHRDGPERATSLLGQLNRHATQAGISLPFSANTLYVNTIHASDQPPYPGNRPLERNIKNIIRWNAMAMVVRANRNEPGIGGHLSTYASAATLFEVGFNHFFRGKEHPEGSDQIYFQGHAAPGVYARAFMEGRLSIEKLENFRRELNPSGGLSSYPHPWLMPDFWEFPTVSMGLSPILAIYQARFNRYLEDRGLKSRTNTKVWALIGDGETDEPEALGAITLASREHLDNLIFVVNCNLQRLDGPVRGNGKIIQELEAVFRGAGWNVIKVIWGSDWDPLLAKDTEGVLVDRMNEVVDGQYQKYTVESGQYIREHFFGTDARLTEMVQHLSDDQLRRLNRGGHDPEKIYAAYKAACEHTESPTVILAKTIKGYGLGESGEGRNITHQQKKLNEDELRAFQQRFGIPLGDEEVPKASFYRPPDDSPEIQYLQDRRETLGGSIPRRTATCDPLAPPPDDLFTDFFKGSGSRELSSTMAFVTMLSKLLRDPTIGRLIVPIVPDEARTFGMDALFRQCGIYSHVGQRYEPVDADHLMYYKEEKNGQLIEEGITEAGSLSTFIAAGTAYATHGIPTIPMFLFYSMFGFQRVGDLIWAAGDLRCRGFLVGATSGRTTLAGEGLQHQDGQSHLLASSVPNLVTYDPAFAYELAVIVQQGIQRMYRDQESVFYYLTVGNENYAMPPMPDGAREGILRGIYKFKPAGLPTTQHRAQLFGSGAILNEVLNAQQILAERYEVAADVWSVTSYNELRRDALEAERWNLLHPLERHRTPYIRRCLADSPGVVVATSDYLKAIPDSIVRWVDRPFISLGTDGFGRSDSRAALRDFFEVDARYVTLATLMALANDQTIPYTVVQQAIIDLKIDPEKANPARA